MLSTEKPPVPEIDLAFAVSATATDADETFNRIKDTAKYIVKKYGTEQIHYALLVFGLIPSRARDFSRAMISKQDMINFLNSVPRSSTGEALLEWTDSFCLYPCLAVPIEVYEKTSA